MFRLALPEIFKVEIGKSQDITQLCMANIFLIYTVITIQMIKKRAKSVIDCLIVLELTKCHAHTMLTLFRNTCFPACNTILAFGFIR